MKMIKKGPRISRGPFYLYLPIPELGPVGVSVDPLGEALGPSVLPDGLWVLFGLAGPLADEPAVLPVVPVVDEPVFPWQSFRQPSQCRSVQVRKYRKARTPLPVRLSQVS